MKITIGPAGSSGLGNEKGILECKKLGLDSMEVEFTYGVKMSNDTAKEIGQVAKENNISLSVHGPYYVNLNSVEKIKIKESKTRILMSCERAHYLGAKHVVFHAGFYTKMSAEETYDNIKVEIKDLQKTIKQKKWDCVLSPETTGKASQFGSLDELLRLVRETGCSICVDFAHLKARNVGIIDYNEVFKKLMHLNHMHCHFSGVEWTQKGERRHIITAENEITELFKFMKKYNINANIINESPDPFSDCVKMKKILQQI